MGPTVALACPRCGRPHDELALACALCGHLLRRAPRPAARPTVPAPSASGTVERSARLEPWLFLGLGLATAPIFAWTPLLRSMGWFLASLVHEMGHAALAWLCGMPAVPAISPGGHAAAVHGPQSLGLALTITAVLAAAAWRGLAGRARWVALVLVLVGHPLVAFSPAGEALHLLAGHAGELLFATLCLWKALDGGFTDSRLERALYGTVGWYLLGRNASLCWGLIHSARARAHYRSNGSFGLTNDYLRLAQDVLGWRLESVAMAMLLASLLVLPAAWLAWRVEVFRGFAFTKQ